MPSQSVLAMAIVAVYLVSVGLIARRFGKLHDQSVAEFAVASRSFKWYMVMFTVLATWIVGATYTAWVGMSIVDGMLAQYAALYGLGGLVVYYLIAPRIWSWGKAHNLYNLPDFIELRYGSKGLAIFIAIAGILLNFPWHIIAFKTFGYVASALTGGAVPFNLGMTIVVLLIAGYVMWGGQRTVVILDFYQGIISVVVVLAGIVFVTYSLFGGFGPLLSRLASEKPELLTIADKPYWTCIILGGIIGSYCWLEIFNRIFVAESVSEVRKVIVGAPFLMVLIFVMLVIMSMGGSLIAEVAADPEAGFLTMFTMAGGPLLLAFAAIVIVAAEMSSIDSQLATNSVVVANNIIKPFKPGLTDRQILTICRISALVFVLSALVVAMMELPMLVSIAIFTYENLVNLFPTIILGALWTRGNKTAAVAGLSVGIPVTLYFTWNATLSQALFGSWTPGIIGFTLNTLIYVIISLASRPQPSTTELFQELES
ncbi:MAG: sodium:solute symporter family protein [Bacillota bacterium]